MKPERRLRQQALRIFRAALAAGRVVEAAELLGNPWFVSAPVVHGDARGRELGYPTANLKLDPGCGLKFGIYAVRVGLEGLRYDGSQVSGADPPLITGRRFWKSTCSTSPAISTAPQWTWRSWPGSAPS